MDNTQTWLISSGEGHRSDSEFKQFRTQGGPPPSGKLIKLSTFSQNKQPSLPSYICKPT